MYRRVLFLGCLLVTASLAAASIETGFQPTKPEIFPITDGGPDPWGYTYVDSDTTPGVPGRPEFNWIDIRLLPGAQRVTGLVDDNVVGPFSLGFEFPFYWLRYSQFYIGSNGYIAFEDQYNESHPFPNVPDSRRPNDMIAALLCDLDFTGLYGNKGCWIWTNPARDTFVMQCESVPFWSAGGNNTFQIILSKPDSTITFQYKEQSGTPRNGWGNNGTIGIENVTGLVGLSYFYGSNPGQAMNAPHAGLAVRFIPPQTRTYSFTDVMVRNAMSWNSGGFFMTYQFGGLPRPIWLWVKNASTDPVGQVEVTGEIKKQTGTTVWFNSTTIPSLTVGENYYVDFGTWTPQLGDTGTFTLKVKVDYPGDQYRANDSVLVEIMVVDYALPTILRFDRQISGSISLADTHGYAMKFEPPRYPVWIESLYFYFGSVAPVNVFIYGDNNNRPGPVLDSIYWIPDPGTGWKALDISLDSISIQSGAFYVGYKTFGSSPSIGVDRTSPFSRQGWEWTGDWAPQRSVETEDMLIRAKVREGFATHNLGIDSIVEPVLAVYDSGTAITPRAILRSFSTYARDTARVTFTLRDQNGQLVYSHTIDSIVILRGRESLLVFPTWIAQPGPLNTTYTPRCSVRNFQLDLDPTNDTLSGTPFYVRYTDAGATAILQPGSNVGYGVVVTPTATVRNHGNQQTSNLMVKFLIRRGAATVYRDSTVVATLGARSETNVTFASWTTDSGSFTTACWTELVGDQVPGNDTAWGSTRVNLYDVGATQVLAPTGVIVQDTQVQPAVRIRDYGTLGGTCNVRFQIRNSGGSIVYDTTHTGVVVPPGDSLVVNFTRRFTASPAGDYSCAAFTIMPEDPHPGNDTARGTFTVRPPDFIDVGAFEIVAPRESIREFTQVRPEVKVRNYGTTNEVCNLTFVIQDNPMNFVLTRQVSINAGESLQVRFDSAWTARNQGIHQLWAFTTLPGDTHRQNDTVYGSTRVIPPSVLDVGVVAIVAPTDSVDSTATIVPTVAVQNYGQLPATFRVWVGIRDEGAGLVYTDTATVINLPQGAPRQLQFAPWPGPHPVGNYAVRCSTFMVGDGNRENDTLTESFRIYAPPQQQPWPTGWSRAREVRLLPSVRPVKEGGWLAIDNGIIYAAKGNKTRDFYSYDPLADTWHDLRGMPVPTGSKLPGKGGVGCSDGNGTIYAVKGNNTLEFYKFDIGSNTWTPLETVPAGPRRQRIKGGTDMVYVAQGDSSYVYLLKGGRNEFYRYNTVSGQWQVLPSAPGGTDAKWDKGSFLVYDNDRTIYAHRAKFGELYAYDVTLGWSVTALRGMPLTSPITGRRSKPGDGSCGAWGPGGIYALKGANTQEFWRYHANGDSWTPLETMPQVGTGGRKKKVKSGGDIVAWADSVFFALKGNKTTEFWRYVRPVSSLMASVPKGGGVAGKLAPAGVLFARIGPSPLNRQAAIVQYSLPSAGVLNVAVHDVAGRLLVKQSLAVGRTGTARLDLGGLSAGVYLVRFSADRFSSTQKLAIE